jgi:hypothetical protein
VITIAFNLIAVRPLPDTIATLRSAITQFPFPVVVGSIQTFQAFVAVCEGDCAMITADAIKTPKINSRFFAMPFFESTKLCLKQQ